MSDYRFSQQGMLFQDLYYALSTLRRQANTPVLHGSFPTSRAFLTRKKSIGKNWQCRKYPNFINK